jgi:hypothetical protein
MGGLLLDMRRRDVRRRAARLAYGLCVVLVGVAVVGGASAAAAPPGATGHVDVGATSSFECP